MLPVKWGGKSIRHRRNSMDEDADAKEEQVFLEGLRERQTGSKSGHKRKSGLP